MRVSQGSGQTPRNLIRDEEEENYDGGEDAAYEGDDEGEGGQHPRLISRRAGAPASSARRRTSRMRSRNGTSISALGAVGLSGIIVDSI
jgi:hypothetical protein